ncbi:MAG: RluA family pseudouridine synthase [Candidatus Pacebacteria bacterium]|nr:RluA family pseudouridine synthase [Candidatus Paceibacterota bacterium]
MNKIKVLYEDSNILAIDKPYGISVHPDGRTKEKTITDWVIKNYPRMKNVGEPMFVENKGKKIEIKRPGVVHRLDRDTSGVMLLAKTQKAHEFLKEQFQNREVKKTYQAIVSGWFKDERGVINKKIGRSPTDFRKYSASRGARGEMRDAVTQYKVLKRFESPTKFTYLEIYPKTGRTHQIRVHMKSVDHPVACDALYNAGSVCPKGLKRMALHALKIEFKDLKGKTVKIESPLPSDIKKFII